MKKVFLMMGFFLSVSLLWAQSQTSVKPNVVIIYADDIGYGDLSCYQPKNRVKTPNTDKLASQGLRCMRAYTSSATCTPSRYSMMTGEYAWRKQGTNVLPGDAPALIKSGRQTLVSIFQKADYQTGIVGKWHLGLGSVEGADWNGEIKETPNDIGFSYSFILAATGDRVPTVYVENRKVVGLDSKEPIQVSYKEKVGKDPTGRENPELLKMKPSHGHDFTIVNGVSRIGYMTGGNAARWIDEDMADIFTQKAVKFIEENKEKPFFLYFSTHDIHVPRMPHARFVGKSGMGARGDALLEFDWSVGEIMNVLDKYGLTENTIVILSSDNGAVLDDGYQDKAVALLGQHYPFADLRGGKGSIFEAGTRVPFIVRYPAKVKKGVSNAKISQVDLLASFAFMLGQEINRNEVKDSQNQLNALLGKDKQGRELIVQHAGTWAIQDGTWKYIEPSNKNKMNVDINIELGNNPEPQLYHLEKDPSEQQNLASKYPKQLKRLVELLEKVKQGK
jgi:arylsulfatase A-like enzyme